MNEVIEVVDDRQQSLKNVGHISYLLHTIVAVGAVLPAVICVLVVVDFPDESLTVRTTVSRKIVSWMRVR